MNEEDKEINSMVYSKAAALLERQFYLKEIEFNVI